MSFNATLVWVIDDFIKAARFAPDHRHLNSTIADRTRLALIRLCKRFNRGDLLPTQQDILSSVSDELSEEDLQEHLKKAHQATKDLLHSLESDCSSALQQASAAGDWGARIESVSLDGFDLLDNQIAEDLAKITQSMLAMKAEQVQGRLAVAQAETERVTRIKHASANAEVLEAEAESAARIKLAEARAANSVRLLEVTENAKADAEAHRIALELEREKTTAQAENKRTLLGLKLEEAQAEAQSITEIAQAHAKKQREENEAATLMPAQTLELRKMQLAVEGLRHFGAAAWKYPDEMSAFIEQLTPFLRVGPSTASEILKGIKGKAVEPQKGHIM